jgi:hypothetical protein
MKASERLRSLSRPGERVIPIYRKIGPRSAGADAFTRDETTELIMDALPYIADVVDAAEHAGIAPVELDRLRTYLEAR